MLWQSTDQCRSLYGNSVSRSDYLITLRSILGANYPPGLKHRMGSKGQGLDAALGDLLYKNKESAENTLIERIEGWKRELSAFVSARRDTLSPQDRGPIMVMQLLTENSNTMLAFVNGPNKMSFDSCLPQF